MRSIFFRYGRGSSPVRTPIRRRVAPSSRRKNRSQDCPSSRPECLALGWVWKSSLKSTQRLTRLHVIYPTLKTYLCVLANKARTKEVRRMGESLPHTSQRSSRQLGGGR